MNTQSRVLHEPLFEPLEESRRRQLIEVTLDSLAELGFVGTTLAQIAGRAGVSPGLVAHYFGDKDGLLDAAFRCLTRRVGDHIRARLRHLSTPRARIQAVIDANLSPAEFSQRTGTAWLAFWGQVLRSPSLRRVQSAHQRRTLTNLRCCLRQLVPPDEARSLAAMIAAMIDGVWLRAALSGWREADSETARALLSDFVDGRLQSARAAAHAGGMRESVRGAPSAPVGERFASYNPATGDLLGYVTAAGASEINAAVRAAQRSQPAWAAAGGAERARILRRAAESMRARRRELAELESRDSGMPLQQTWRDVECGADCLDSCAALAETTCGQHVNQGAQAFSYTRREPLGVVAGVGAWRHPLLSLCRQAAPALACGNAMIFKPSEFTPLSAVALADMLLEAGLPAALLQVLQGVAETGQLLLAHSGVQKPTGSDALDSGKTRMADATLIVFDEASLDTALSAVCRSSATRLFVHASVKDACLQRLLQRVRALRVGDPLDPATQVGAVVSEQHLQHLLSSIERSRTEGARLAIGGTRLTAGVLGRGCFVAPAIIDGCHDDMSIMREAIDGPVMSILEFESEREVIERANAMAVAPAVGVFTHDLSRAHRVIAALRAGTCWINHHGGDFEHGAADIEFYTRPKNVYVTVRTEES